MWSALWLLEVIFALFISKSVLSHAILAKQPSWSVEIPPVKTNEYEVKTNNHKEEAPKNSVDLPSGLLSDRPLSYLDFNLLNQQLIAFHPQAQQLIDFNQTTPTNTESTRWASNQITSEPNNFEASTQLALYHPFIKNNNLLKALTTKQRRSQADFTTSLLLNPNRLNTRVNYDDSIDNPNVIIGDFPMRTPFYGLPHLSTAASYPQYHYAVPSKTVAAHRKGLEKSLGIPILVGVGAALISFLIISNLFLSIPLFAMTLIQLFHGGNNNMIMPNNNNNQPPSINPNGGQGSSTSGRRKRRDIPFQTDRTETNLLKAIHLYPLN